MEAGASRRPANKLLGALEWRLCGNLYVLGQYCPSVIQLVSVGSVSQVIVYVEVFNFLYEKYNYERVRAGGEL